MLLVSLVIASFLAICGAVSVGDRLVRTYGGYTSLPTTVDAAVAAGFAPVNGTCIENLGILYANGGKVSEKHPTLLYFTRAGQLSGVGVEVYYGNPFDSLVQANVYEKIADKEYRISVAFRDPSLICLGQIDASNVIGDRVIVNPNGVNFNIPTVLSDATALGFYPGSCFNGMGTHYYWDLSKNGGKPSWVAENLLPVIPMYHNGVINAVFFTTTIVQQGVFGANEWEPIPLINTLMCENFCDKDCTFSETSIWSTFHYYFNDYSAVKCDDCITGIGCCSGWPYTS